MVTLEDVASKIEESTVISNEEIIIDTNELTTDTMMTLVDNGLSIRFGDRVRAVPNEMGTQYVMDVETMALIIQSREKIESTKGDPVEFAEVTQKLVESEEETDMTSVAETIESLSVLSQIFYDQISDEMIESLKEVKIDHIDPSVETRQILESGIEFVVEGDIEKTIEESTEDIDLPRRGTKKRMVLETMVDRDRVVSTDLPEITGYENADRTLGELYRDDLLHRDDSASPYVYWIKSEVSDALE